MGIRTGVVVKRKRCGAKAAVSSASFLKGTMLFIFISEFHLRKRNAKSWNIGSMDV
jgi:hypothetical protein